VIWGRVALQHPGVRLVARPLEAGEAEDRVQFDRVGCYAGLVVPEVPEGDDSRRTLPTLS
jgi:hypothetical protein